MSIPLNKASKVIDKAVRGIFPDEDESVVVDGHHFFIRSVKNKNLLKGDETGYFRHQHVGQDDRVFYTVKLGKKKGEHRSFISRIEFRGPLNKDGTKRFGIEVTGALGIAGGIFGGILGGPEGAAAGKKAGEIAAKIIRFLQDLNLQAVLDGNWPVAAAKCVDAIGRRMAQDIK
jgi:hypothetical protein